MPSDSLKIDGAIRAELYKADGTVSVTEKHNLIVNVGYDFIANAIGLASSRPGVMNTICVGTGTTAVAATHTALVKQLAYKAASYAHSASTKVFTFTTTFNAGEATGAITEAGVFNGNGGIMFDRVVFAVINKGAADILKITFTFTMS